MGRSLSLMVVRHDDLASSMARWHLLLTEDVVNDENGSLCVLWASGVGLCKRRLLALILSLSSKRHHVDIDEHTHALDGGPLALLLVAVGDDWRDGATGVRLSRHGAGVSHAERGPWLLEVVSDC